MYISEKALAMAKFKYSAEFEFEAPAPKIFHYLATPEGLEKWFAESVRPVDEKNYDIVWDGQNHPAEICAFRSNSYVRFRFHEPDAQEQNEVAYIDFRLNRNEMTETVFLKITDYSETEEEEDLSDLWTNLVGDLRDALLD